MSPEKAQEAAQKQLETGRRIDDVLVEMGLVPRQKLDELTASAFPEWGTKNTQLFHRANAIQKLGKPLTKRSLLSGRKAELDRVDTFAKQVFEHPYQLTDATKLRELVEHKDELVEKLNRESQENWPVTEKRVKEVAETLVSMIFTKPLALGPMRVPTLEENPPDLREVKAETKLDEGTHEPYFEVTGRIRGADRADGDSDGSFTLRFNPVGKLLGSEIDLGPAVLRKIAARAVEQLTGHDSARVQHSKGAASAGDRRFEVTAGRDRYKVALTQDGFVRFDSMERIND